MAKPSFPPVGRPLSSREVRITLLFPDAVLDGPLLQWLEEAGRSMNLSAWDVEWMDARAKTYHRDSTGHVSSVERVVPPARTKR